jgi:NAD(P)-dependent dehydrogenase (short-subunit alcohol dehydrogenase family)
LIRLLVPGMKEKGNGTIVNVSSVAAYTSPAGEAPYAATKAALHSLTRTVATEVGPYGIRCNTVAPGLIWTRFLEKNEEQFRPELEKTPLRRFGHPEDVADVIAFLASEESRFITGETIVVSGGWCMGN